MSSLHDNGVDAPPPLKKRATKRGLGRLLNSDSNSDSASESNSHLTSVYSSCVERSSIFSLSSLERKPLLDKQEDNDSSSTKPVAAVPSFSKGKRGKNKGKNKRVCHPPVVAVQADISQTPTRKSGRNAGRSTRSATNTTATSNTTTTTSTAVTTSSTSVLFDGDLSIDLDFYDDENSVTVEEARSPSPPCPPPPPPPLVAARSRPRRLSKGLKSAFQKLDTMKGELFLANLLTTPPTPAFLVVDDDSPVSTTQTVRVRYISDVHRFTMNKTDMFYNLQQQMATLLKVVDAEQVGLFLNDRRLGACETPLTAELDLADIIQCHVLVPNKKTGDGGDASTEQTDEDSIRITLQCPNSRQKKHLVTKKYLPLKILFEKYAKVRERPLSSFSFHFDGELLSPDSTPIDVDMDDDDTIDVAEKD